MDGSRSGCDGNGGNEVMRQSCELLQQQTCGPAVGDVIGGVVPVEEGVWWEWAWEWEWCGWSAGHGPPPDGLLGQWGRRAACSGQRAAETREQAGTLGWRLGEKRGPMSNMGPCRALSRATIVPMSERRRARLAEANVPLT